MQKISTTPLIREKAEELFYKRGTEYTRNLSETDSIKLLHELEIHQIELELQNEELANAIKKEKETTKKFAALYDFAPIGYFTLNRYGEIEELNLNAAKMLGKERSFLIGKNLQNYIHTSFQFEFLSFLRKIFEYGLKQECEIGLTLPDNLLINLQLNGIVSESEKAFVTAVDITEKKKVEKALQENEARLEELNATKDKFFSIIAHDLRSPVTSIIGFSEMMLRDIQKNDLENIEKYVRIILNSTHKTMDLLSNLLEWARMQTGKLRFNPARCELNEIINQAIDLLEGPFQQKSISISFIPLQKTFVIADKEMLSNVFRNLLSNAIKFTHENGKVEVDVSTGTQNVLVRIRDNGIGISMKNISNLFKLDKSFSTKGTRDEQGTGLGLLLCKEFIGKHDGSIWAESEPGKGSSFYFTLPV